jgi:hypothetical protein
MIEGSVNSALLIGIRDLEWKKKRIWDLGWKNPDQGSGDNHPGPATLMHAVE